MAFLLFMTSLLWSKPTSCSPRTAHSVASLFSSLDIFPLFPCIFFLFYVHQRFHERVVFNACIYFSLQTLFLSEHQQKRVRSTSSINVSVPHQPSCFLVKSNFNSRRARKTKTIKKALLTSETRSSFFAATFKLQLISLSLLHTHFCQLFSSL